MTSSIPRLLSLTVALAIPPGSSGPSATHAAPPLAGPAVGLATQVGSPELGAAEPRIELFSVPGSSIHRVRATIVVEAPIERVRSVVFDFARYPEFMVGYKRATVLRADPAGSRVVQMELEQLGGAIRLWMRIGITAPMRVAGVESYRGRL